MTFEVIESKTVRLEQGDTGFMIVDHFSTVPRAQLEISNDCPDHITHAIVIATQKGWLKPVAYMKKTELVFDMLQES